MKKEEFFKKYPNKSLNDYYSYLSQIGGNSENEQRHHTKNETSFTSKTENHSFSVKSFLIGCAIGVLVGFFILPIAVNIADSTLNVGSSTIICPNCTGRGETPVKCTICYGAGKYEGHTCWTCMGRGNKWEVCSVCAGKKRVPE